MSTTRREFLTATAALATAPAYAAAPGPLTIIDCHTHFYDPKRPEGVPWPGKGDNVLYRTMLPTDYRAQPVPQPVTGTVVVEASPLVEDNQWILDLAAKDKFIVGFVGNLKPGEDAFAGHLKRFAANPLYRGIRISEGALRTGLGNAAFIVDIKRLADADLELDVNGGPTLLPEVARLAKELPGLRIVINHLSNTRIDGKNVLPTWRADLEAAAKFPQVFLKVSALVEGTGKNDGSAPRDVEFYRPWLDIAWNAFGPDRLIYGSNWPVSERFAKLATVQGIVHDYFGAKGRAALEKFFAGNARTAYRWVRR
ncbi:MAG: amidohydrolase [Verrucomicrobia bacterium]|nr:amidohydrolase [Verrucomicrobiota bacterium]NBU08066.1 amidohydrolase [Pseudomonadota bacterium]NDA66634.1 amidohydrolase [Verrucomicrobiota bacterium]NDB75779.1 amidohydrolase [Verrucomicrobiota bacterium]NDD37336.1 amidohydrolase [Verrucomicrobiota bacterium]